jgi:hypothetical protein
MLPGYITLPSLPVHANLLAHSLCACRSALRRLGKERRAYVSRRLSFSCTAVASAADVRFAERPVPTPLPPLRQSILGDEHSLSSWASPTLLPLFIPKSTGRCRHLGMWLLCMQPSLCRGRRQFKPRLLAKSDLSPHTHSLGGHPHPLTTMHALLAAQYGTVKTTQQLQSKLVLRQWSNQSASR